MTIEIVAPDLWINHWRVRRALVGYPLYDLPNKICERDLPEDDYIENYRYFMRVRLERLIHFQEWLKYIFGITVTLSPDGVIALDRWVSRFGGGLVYSGIEDIFAFGSYRHPWAGAFAGHNVIVDIGIFMGEYVLAKRGSYKWSIYQGHEGEPASYCSTGYRRPTIDGLPRGWKSDVLTAAYGIVMDQRRSSLVGAFRSKKAVAPIAMQIKSILYADRASDESRPFIFGNSDEEPL